ncbi:type-1 angiotensin II receptor-associated protein isoform X5 [Mauremys mutica]|uniref:type-1 angiotensin II receptor-associated protein isoform X5 n=1 Tax=Mauremys mutica TaxID=74926 RepID=UPI001D16C7AA|nr:type-1 angiotensin II receptor-associated protein isoform X5 [Mauremys mutica]
MEVPAVNLKAIVLVHWLLTTWGCLLFPDSYTWGNFTVLAVGVWAIAQRDSIDAIIMFLIGLLITILLDIINISLFYPRDRSLSDLQRFSSGMAIFSLLLKPLSCLFVYQMYRERGGEYIVNLGRRPHIQFLLSVWAYPAFWILHAGSRSGIRTAGFCLS